MVSRQETARQLITPGEIMQLPSHEELILLSGFSPIKAQKVRYYADKNFTGRVLSPPQLTPNNNGDLPPSSHCVWGQRTRPVDDRLYSDLDKSEQEKIAAALNDSSVFKENSNKLEHGINADRAEIEMSNTLDKAEDETPTPVFPLPQFTREPSALVRAHGMSNSVSPDMGIGT
jgi:type IV secretion system protein VirD4